MHCNASQGPADQVKLGKSTQSRAGVDVGKLGLRNSFTSKKELLQGSDLGERSGEQVFGSHQFQTMWTDGGYLLQTRRTLDRIQIQI
jgi:hypothetical protein